MGDSPREATGIAGLGGAATADTERVVVQGWKSARSATGR
jgi:hypothetical protein